MDRMRKELALEGKPSKTKKPRLSLQLNLGYREATGYWATVPQDEIITIRSVLGKNLSLTPKWDVLNSVRLSTSHCLPLGINNQLLFNSAEIAKR